jgi:hypothetical protein
MEAFFIFQGTPQPWWFSFAIVASQDRGKHIMKKFFGLLIVVACSTLAFAANWPPSIVGTWIGFGNQAELKLVITNQGGTGECKAIAGTLSNVQGGGSSNIQGFYCPATGRVSFVRKDAKTNATFQSYTANVSDAGPELRMAGTFAEVNFAGHLGEYNFSVQKSGRE